MKSRWLIPTSRLEPDDDQEEDFDKEIEGAVKQYAEFKKRMEPSDAKEPKKSNKRRRGRRRRCALTPTTPTTPTVDADAQDAEFGRWIFCLPLSASCWWRYATRARGVVSLECDPDREISPIISADRWPAGAARSASQCWDARIDVCLECDL